MRPANSGGGDGRAIADPHCAVGDAHHDTVAKYSLGDGLVEADGIVLPPIGIVFGGKIWGLGESTRGGEKLGEEEGSCELEPATQRNGHDKSSAHMKLTPVLYWRAESPNNK